MTPEVQALIDGAAWERLPPQERGLREGLVRTWDECVRRYSGILSNMRDACVREHAREIRAMTALPAEAAARFCPARADLLTE
jgi:hypothetical protein